MLNPFAGGECNHAQQCHLASVVGVPTEHDLRLEYFTKICKDPKLDHASVVGVPTKHDLRFKYFTKICKDPELDHLIFIKNKDYPLRNVGSVQIQRAVK